MDKRQKEEKASRLANEIIRRCAAEKKVVEVGWCAFQILCLQGVPADQLADFRVAFFSGAQHLFAAIMGIMEDGKEPTERDMDNMDAIHEELQSFLNDNGLQPIAPWGSA